MSRVRSSMVLLGICIVALLIGTLRVATDRPPLPTGSSYSTQPDGAQGLYDWADTDKVLAALNVHVKDTLPVRILMLQRDTKVALDVAGFRHVWSIAMKYTGNRSSRHPSHLRRG